MDRKLWLHRLWHRLVEGSKPILMLAIIVAATLAVTVTGWISLAAYFPNPLDRSNAALALATVLLASLTVWSTLLSQRETRRNREYDAYVALQPRVVWMRVGPRSEFGIGAGDYGEYPSRDISAVIDFREEDTSPKGVTYSDEATRFDLAIYNNGRGTAHDLRLLQTSFPCRIKQTPEHFSISPGTELAIAIILIGRPIPGQMLTVDLDFKDAFERLYRLSVHFKHYRLLERDDTIRETWIIERYRTL